MANQIKAVVYTSDLGVQYVIGMNKEVFDQNNVADTAPKVGGEAYNGTDPIGPMPANIRPRQARLVNPAGKIRYVEVLTTDATLIAPTSTGADRQLTLEDSDGVSTTYTLNGTLGERSRRRHARTGV